ncbi:MAG: transporter associated domain-containing protein [Pseudomonadota bacterium]
MNDGHSTKPRVSKGTLRRLLGRLKRNFDQRLRLVETLHDAEAKHVIDSDTLAMMEGALLVSENQVRDIMLPRSEVTFINETATPEEFLPEVIESGHSRFPVFDDKRERVIGILLAKDLLPLLASDNEAFDLHDKLRPAVFVPESKRLNILLREFKASRNHLAIVADEYGEVAGIISIEDVIEQIVGDIDDEHDEADDEMIRRHRGDRYTVKAITPIDDFNEFFSVELEAGEFETIGGLVIGELGHVPARGEELELGDFHLKVLRADRRRIRLLRVIPSASPEQNAQT